MKRAGNFLLNPMVKPARHAIVRCGRAARPEGVHLAGTLGSNGNDTPKSSAMIPFDAAATPGGGA